MKNRKTLIQIDTDDRPSTFDSMVAIDSGIDFLLTNANVSADNVEAIVHGAMFTRGPDDLKNTAIFVGGSDVRKGEQVVDAIGNCFFGPIRVSLMLDSNGANTTAVAAVLSASRHLEFAGKTATILAGTGSVGIRTAELLAAAGAQVRLTSRSAEKARQAILQLNEAHWKNVSPVLVASEKHLQSALDGAELVFATGAAGVVLWPQVRWNEFNTVQVAIDLNAVPPSGIEVIDVSDKAKEIDGVVCYGAVGVGGLKMKIHRAAIGRLFERNDLTLDVNEIFAIGQELIG
jgi:hypothetical protein